MDGGGDAGPCDSGGGGEGMGGGGSSGDSGGSSGGGWKGAGTMTGVSVGRSAEMMPTPRVVLSEEGLDLLSASTAASASSLALKVMSACTTTLAEMYDKDTSEMSELM